MKTKKGIRRLILHLFIIAFSLTASSQLIAQEKKNENLNEFKVVIEKNNNGVKLKCEEGCAWKELSYSMNDYRPQAIDKFGMSELNKDRSNKDLNLSGFLFTVTKTKTGIDLKGIKGTAWTNLSFSLLENKQQAINQFGTID